MKVTALISDHLVEEVKKYSGGRTITESIIIALTDFVARQRLSKNLRKVRRQPLSFTDGFAASKVRKLNRAE